MRYTRRRGFPYPPLAPSPGGFFLPERNDMAFRHKMGRSSSKRLFSATASRKHKKNFTGASRVMRGGIRL